MNKLYYPTDFFPPITYKLCNELTPKSCNFCYKNSTGSKVQKELSTKKSNENLAKQSMFVSKSSSSCPTAGFTKAQDQ